LETNAMKLLLFSVAIFRSSCAAVKSRHDAKRNATECSLFSIHLGKVYR
jgi:hypothetical protein